MSDSTPTSAAVYARVSTKDQDTESQVQVCTDHVRNHNDIDTWEHYSDIQSGHDDGREDYVRLKTDIANGEHDYFVCTEFSRISRNDSEIKNFIEDCLNQDMGVEIIQSSFSIPRDPDPLKKQALKMVADTLANISTMEQLQKIDRINRGISHAREHGTWTKKPPRGFEVEDETQQLRVKPGEFLAIRDALLEHYYRGTSWSELAARTGVPRSTLSNYYNDEDKRRLYVHAEGWDKWERDTQALRDADMETYVQARDDAPDYIDPDNAPGQQPDPTPLHAEEHALMETIHDALTDVKDGNETPSPEALASLYQEKKQEHDSTEEANQ